MGRNFFRLIVIFIISITSNCSYAQDQYEIIASHPRIVLTKEAELSLQFLFLESDDAKNIQASLKQNADKFLEEKSPNSTLIKESIQKNNLDKLFYKVTTLAMAYRLFEDDKYAAMVNQFLVAICQLPDWKTVDLEVTAELTSLCGLGYDWLYYFLNREDRELIRNSIIQKGLNPGLEALTNYSDSSSYFSQNTHKMLLVSSGFVLGSLAVADDFPEINKRVIYRFLINNKQTLEELTFERIREMYGEEWNENLSYLYMVLASLNASLGHDFNITSLENIKSLSTDYLGFIEVDINSENANTFLLNPAILWFAKLNSNTEAGEFFMESVKKYHLDASQKAPLNYMCLIWMI